MVVGSRQPSTAVIHSTYTTHEPPAPTPDPLQLDCCSKTKYVSRNLEFESQNSKQMPWLVAGAGAICCVRSNKGDTLTSRRHSLHITMDFNLMGSHGNPETGANDSQS